MRRNVFNTFILVPGLILGGLSSSHAGERPVGLDGDLSSEGNSGSFCESLWDHAMLYANPENPLLQNFALTGRIHVDTAFFSEDDLGDYDALLWRRARLGFKAKVLRDFTIHAVADFDLNERDPLYSRLTVASLSWSRSPAFKLTVGKQAAGFTLDGATSSNRLLTVDRSNIANNLWYPVLFHTGVQASGTIEEWTYQLGLYDSSGGDEFGDFGGGHFLLGSVGYDLGKRIGLDKAEIRLDYVNNDPDENNDGTRRLSQVGSLVLKIEDDDWGLWTDVSAGDGYLGQSDLFGVQVMPFYNFTEKLQGVLRYTYLRSREDNGVRLTRYENRIEQGLGDESNEIYLGLNYYLCGHKLKVQTGIQYADMADRADDGGKYAGWGWSTGFRLSW